jgi:hypothetical protein
MLIVTHSPRISISRCILLAANFLSNMPNAEIYVTCPSRLKDIGRQRLVKDEKVAASRFALWSEECRCRAVSTSAQVIVVLDPFEPSVSGPHKDLLASLKPVENVFLVASAIDFFRKNARVGDQARGLFSLQYFCLPFSRRTSIG